MPFLTAAILLKQKEWNAIPTEKEAELSGEMSPQLKVTTKVNKHLLRDSHIKFQGDVTLLKSQSRIDDDVSPPPQNAILNETMQDLIEIQLFNMNIAIVFNDLFCVATVASIKSSSGSHKNPLA